ncbi:MAG TPA: glycosyltransferase family 2 protein [Roseiflexaceae bacterium]|nr:glycosyltransferase family 2 protein [Roseiflexaceae bacterium]
MMPSLAIITVSWNTRELLHRCIDSVHSSLGGSGLDYSIVIVDNASSDGTPAMLRLAHPEVRLIESGRNLGFAGGNNLALRRVLGDEGWGMGVGSGSPTPNSQLPTPQYVMLLNPDTEIVGDALPRLVRYLENHPDVAVVGPKLLYPAGSAQPSRRRFPTKATFFWESTPLETRWPANPWAQRHRCADSPDDVEQEVGWLVGAALLVRRTAIERAGLLDAGFQMYSEELEWQRRIRGMGDGGWGVESSPQPPRIMYLPDAVIVHHEGKSSEQAPAQRYLNFQRSRLRDANMTFGPRFAAALRLFLRAAYAGELAIEAGKWLLGHKRALRAQRVRIYWQLLREL